MQYRFQDTTRIARNRDFSYRTCIWGSVEGNQSECRQNPGGEKTRKMGLWQSFTKCYNTVKQCIRLRRANRIPTTWRACTQRSASRGKKYLDSSVGSTLRRWTSISSTPAYSCAAHRKQLIARPCDAILTSSSPISGSDDDVCATSRDFRWLRSETNVARGVTGSRMQRARATTLNASVCIQRGTGEIQVE